MQGKRLVCVALIHMECTESKESDRPTYRRLKAAGDESQQHVTAAYAFCWRWPFHRYRRSRRQRREARPPRPALPRPVELTVEPTSQRSDARRSGIRLWAPASKVWASSRFQISAKLSMFAVCGSSRDFCGSSFLSSRSIHWYPFGPPGITDYPFTHRALVAGDP